MYDWWVTDPNMQHILFSTHFVCTYTRDSKTTCCIWKFCISNDCSTVEDVCFLLCQSWIWDTIGKLWLQTCIAVFLLLSHLCLLADIHITWKLQVMYGRWAYQMIALLLETFFVCFIVTGGTWEIQLERYRARYAKVILWYNIVCAYSASLYICTLLFGAQLCMTTILMYLMIA